MRIIFNFTLTLFISILFSTHSTAQSSSYFENDINLSNKSNSNNVFLSSTNSSGSANIEIPLGSLNSGNFDVPVFLSYSREGRKMNESDNDLGLGWTLNYGGTINSAPGKLDYFQLSSTDWQPMQFSYSTFKGEGQFFFNPTNTGYSSGAATQMPMSENKITVYKAVYSDGRIDSIKIQTPDRKIFNFVPNGRVYVDIGSQTIDGCDVEDVENYVNKFTISRIHNLDSKTLVSFDYDTECTINQYDSYNYYNITGESIDQVREISKNVESVKPLNEMSSKYARIEFIRDEYGDHQINEIHFFNEKDEIIRKIEFVYEMKPYQNDENIRFLQQVLFRNQFDELISKIDLGYYEFSKFEQNARYAQDYWGFYNGKYSNESLFIEYGFNKDTIFETKDRNPSYEHTVEGMLKSVATDKGNIENYYYELNDYSKMAGDTDFVSGNYHKFQTLELNSLLSILSIPFTENSSNATTWTTLNFTEPIEVEGDQNVIIRLGLENPSAFPQMGNCQECSEIQLMCEENGNPSNRIILPPKHINPLMTAFNFELSSGDYTIKARRLSPNCIIEGQEGYDCNLVGGLTFTIKYKGTDEQSLDVAPKMGGLRIKKIEGKDGNGSTQTSNYIYRLSGDPDHSSGILVNRPEYSTIKPVDYRQIITGNQRDSMLAVAASRGLAIHMDAQVESHLFGPDYYEVHILGLDSLKLTNSDISGKYFNTQNSPVVYTCISNYVTGSNLSGQNGDGRQIIGRTESEYSFNHTIYQDIDPPFQQHSLKDWEIGNLIEKRFYNISDEIVKRVTRSYDYVKTENDSLRNYGTSTEEFSFKTRYLLENQKYLDKYNLPENYPPAYSINSFVRNVYAYRYVPVEEKIFFYDNDQLKSQTTITNSYATDKFGYLESVEITDDNNNIYRTFYKYTKDFDYTGYSYDNVTQNLEILRSFKNLYHEPVLTYQTLESTGSNSERLIDAMCYLYATDDFSTVPYVNKIVRSKANIDTDSSSLASIIEVDGKKKFEFNPDIFENSIEIDLRNELLSPIEVSDKTGTNFSLMRNLETYRVNARVIDGKLASSRYTSFEDPDYNGGWYYDQSNVVSATPSETAITGDFYYNLGDVNGNDGDFNSGTGGTFDAAPAGKYLLSYWSKGNVSTFYNNNGQELDQTSITENGWTYVEKIIEWDSTEDNFVTMTGDGYIDELRLHEIDATMETKGYYPDGKVMYEASPSGDVVTYEYDSKNRLEWILNRKRKVIEHREYQDKDITDENSYNKVTVSTTRVDDLTKSDVENATLSNYNVRRSTTFSDGLGRVRQSIDFRANDQGSLDLVSFKDYDAFGRELKQYLPYWETYLSPESDYIQAAEADQAAYYATPSYSVDILETTDSPFIETKIEASPLQRPIEQGGIGDELQPGTGHTTTMEYGWNDQNDAILKWEYDTQNNSVTAVGNYPVNQLKKTTQTSPDGKVIHSFTDARGRKVAVAVEARVLSDANGKYYTKKTQGSGGTLRAITSYTVSDDFGRVVYEIPAKAIEEMGSTFQLNPDNPTNTFKELINWYKYDAHGRVIEKQTPGQGRTYFVYDRKDRLVMSQDAQQRLENKWSFIKRDTRGRVVLKGEIASSQNRQDHQDYFDNDPIYEETFDPALSGNVLGYSNDAHPSIAESDVLNVYYFDNYDFNPPPQFGFLIMGEVTTPLEVTRGLATGSKTRVLKSDGTLGEWLTTVSYYDHKKRPVQAFTENHRGGWDQVNTYYNERGQVEKTIQYHRLTDTSEVHTFQTRYTYFEGSGRLQNTWCRIDMDPEVLVSNRRYADNGQLKELKLHRREEASNFLQRINYRYNAQGNLVFINDPALTASDIGSSDFDDVFGQQLVYFDTENELEYDPNNSSYDITPRYDGNISAMLWNAKTPEEDGTTLKQNAYIYHYDDFGQMTAANYAADDPSFPGEYNTDVGHFNESVEYGLGGTTRSLSRNGIYMQEENILAMDSLKYEYLNAGYKPMNIDDHTHQVYDQNLKHFVDGADAHHEYTYDAVGRTLTDQNRGVTFYYNRLGLPRKIVHNATGYYIAYTYDAAGNKLQKKFKRELPETQQMEVVSKDYIGNFLYEQDNIELIYHPEGVIRPTPPEAENTTDYVYDYFIKDYLGNVRVVLTEENATYTNKFLATMEEVYRLIEEDNFDNINETAEPLPSGYPIDGSVEFNERIAELSEATGTQIGPSIVLPVRRGDKVSLSTRYFYDEPGEGTTYDNVNLIVNEILMSLATSGSGVLQLNETQLIDIASGNGDYGSAIMNLLSSNFDTSDVSRPNSYLIWMLYDNEMKLIPEGSGAKRVSNPNELGTLIEQDIPALTDGYLHCFVSNSAVQPVSYDNFLASYLRGQTRQINHYYPYGLSIDGLSRSDEYLNKYTSKELQTGEFDPMVSSGLEMFDFHARFYDPALGRWFTPDPAEQFSNPYLAMGNNPVRYTDPNGMYTGIYDFDEDGGGGGGDGDPGNGMELGWDGGYHGVMDNNDSFRLSNYNPSSSQMASSHSWLNSFGAHNGSFAPFRYNGNTYYYHNGNWGYQNTSANFQEPGFNWPNNGGNLLPRAEVVGNGNDGWVFLNQGDIAFAIGDYWRSQFEQDPVYNGQAWYGTNFIGPGPDLNPYRIINPKNAEQFLRPIDAIDLAAQRHDYAYWRAHASGIHGALFNNNVIVDDMYLVINADRIMEGYLRGTIDPVTNQPISFRTYSVSFDVYVAFTAVSWYKFFSIK